MCLSTVPMEEIPEQLGPIKFLDATTNRVISFCVCAIKWNNVVDDNGNTSCNRARTERDIKWIREMMSRQLQPALTHFPYWVNYLKEVRTTSDWHETDSLFRNENVLSTPMITMVYQYKPLQLVRSETTINMSPSRVKRHRNGRTRIRQWDEENQKQPAVSDLLLLATNSASLLY